MRGYPTDIQKREGGAIARLPLPDGQGATDIPLPPEFQTGPVIAVVSPSYMGRGGWRAISPPDVYGIFEGEVYRAEQWIRQTRITVYGIADPDRRSDELMIEAHNPRYKDGTIAGEFEPQWKEYTCTFDLWHAIEIPEGFFVYLVKLTGPLLDMAEENKGTQIGTVETFGLLP